jgi:hypothetical protein
MLGEMAFINIFPFFNDKPSEPISIKLSKNDNLTAICELTA